MKNILLLFILFTGLISWGQDYDVYLNSFHSEDQSKTFQKFTYKIPEHVNSVRLNFDPRVVPDAFYVKYGDQEFWSYFVGEVFVKEGGLYKMISVPESEKERYFRDIYPSRLYEDQPNENSNIVDRFPRNFAAELVWYKKNDGLLESINTEISKVGGKLTLNNIFTDGDSKSESITKSLINVESKLFDVFNSYGNVLEGERDFIINKQNGVNEITIMVFSPLHGRLFDVLINTCETCQEPTIDISEIEFKDSKILLNGSLFNGFVTERYKQDQTSVNQGSDKDQIKLIERYDKEQIKSIKRVQNGLIVSEKNYHKDNNYEKNLSTYKSIDIIKIKSIELSKMNDELNQSVEEEKNLEGIRNNLKEIEIGDKFDKYEEKYNEGNLKGKKLEKYKSYLDYKKRHKEKVEINKKKKKSRNQFKNFLFDEFKKPFYQPTLKESFTYVNGQRTGVHKEYNKNEKLLLEEELKDGVRNGSYKRYENGKVKEEGTYQNNLKEGEWTIYSYNGKEIYNYSNDIKEGEYKKYNGDVVVQEGTYQNNLKEGEWNEYYDNGETVALFKGGKKNGPFGRYFKDSLIELGMYSNDLMVDDWAYKYSNGKLKAFGKFLNGDGGNVGSSGIPKNGREGKWLFFHENGNKSVVGSFVNGKEDGEFFFYYENGQIKQSSKYENGQKQGDFILWHDNGQIRTLITYVNDKPKNESIRIDFNPDGTEKDKYIFVDGQWEEYLTPEEQEALLIELKRELDALNSELDNLNNSSSGYDTYDYSSSSSKSSSPNSCSLCQGSGKCYDCSKPQKVYYWRNGWQIDKETRLGKTVCTQCRGDGKIKEHISNGKMDRYENCFVSSCNNGWIKCRRCYGDGECDRCHGKGTRD